MKWGLVYNFVFLLNLFLVLVSGKYWLHKNLGSIPSFYLLRNNFGSISVSFLGSHWPPWALPISGKLRQVSVSMLLIVVLSMLHLLFRDIGPIPLDSAGLLLWRNVEFSKVFSESNKMIRWFLYFNLFMCSDALIDVSMLNLICIGGIKLICLW